MAQIQDSLGRQANIGSTVDDVKGLLRSMMTAKTTNPVPFTTKENPQKTEQKDQKVQEIITILKGIGADIEDGIEETKEYYQKIEKGRSSLPSPAALPSPTKDKPSLEGSLMQAAMPFMKRGTSGPGDFSTSMNESLMAASSVLSALKKPSLIQAQEIHKLYQKATHKGSLYTHDIYTVDSLQDILGAMNQMNANLAMARNPDQVPPTTGQGGGGGGSNNTGNTPSSGSGGAGNLHLVSSVLVAAVTEVLGGFDLLKSVFGDLAGQEIKFMQNMREIAFQTQGITGDTEDLQNAWQETGKTVAQTGKNATIFENVLVNELKKGIKSRKDENVLIKTGLNLSTMIGTNAENTAGFFHDLHMSLGASNNSMAQLSRGIQSVALATGVTGENLLDAVKASEGFLMNMRNASTYTAEAATNLIGIQATAKKLGIADEAQRFSDALSSSTKLYTEATDQTKALLFSAAASVGKIQDLSQGTLLNTKAGIGDLAKGIDNIVKRFGVEGGVEGIAGLDPQRLMALNLQLKAAYGLESGQLKALHDTYVENSKDFASQEADINKEMANTNLTMQERINLEDKKNKLEMNAGFSFLTAFDDASKKAGMGFQDAITAATKQLGPEFETQLKQMGIDITDPIKELQGVAQLTAKKIKEAGGEDFSPQLDKAINNKDTVQVREILSKMNAEQQKIGVKEAKGLDPLTQIQQYSAEANEALRRFTGPALRALISMLGALGIIALEITALGLNVLNVGSTFHKFWTEIRKPGAFGGRSNAGSSLVGDAEDAATGKSKVSLGGTAAIESILNKIYVDIHELLKHATQKGSLYVHDITAERNMDEMNKNLEHSSATQGKAKLKLTDPLPEEKTAEKALENNLTKNAEKTLETGAVETAEKTLEKDAAQAIGHVGSSIGSNVKVVEAVESDVVRLRNASGAAISSWTGVFGDMIQKIPGIGQSFKIVGDFFENKIRDLVKGITQKAAGVAENIAGKGALQAGKSALTSAAPETAAAAGGAEAIGAVTSAGETATIAGGEAAAAAATAETAEVAATVSLGAAAATVGIVIAAATAAIGGMVGELQAGEKAAELFGEAQDKVTVNQYESAKAAGLLTGALNILTLGIFSKQLGAVGSWTQALSKFFASTFIFTAMLTPITATLDTLWGVLKGVYLFLKNVFVGLWEGIEAAVAPVVEIFDYMKKVFDDALAPLDKVQSSFVEMGGISGMLSSAIGSVGKAIGFLLKSFGQLVGFILKALVPVAKVLINIIGGFIKAIVRVVEAVLDTFGGVFDFIAGIATFDWDKIKKGVFAIFTSIPSLFWDAIKSTAGLIYDGIAAIPGLLYDGIMTAAKGFYVVFSEIPMWFLGVMKDALILIPGWLLNAFESVLIELPLWIFDKITKGLSELADSKLFGPIFQPILEMWKSLQSALMEGLKPLASIFDELSTIWDDFRKSLNGILGPAQEGSTFLSALGKALSFLGTVLNYAVIKPLEILAYVLSEVAGFMISTMVPGFKVLFAVLGFGFKIIGQIVESILNVVVPVIKSFVKIVEGAFEILAGIFTLNFSKIWQGVKDLFGGILGVVWNSVIAIPKLLYNLVVNVGGLFVDLLETMGKAVGTVLGKIWHGIAAIPGLFWTALKAIPGLLFDGLKFVVETALKILMGAVIGVVAVFVGLPALILYGIWKGLEALWGLIEGAAKWIGDSFMKVIGGVVDAAVWIKDSFIDSVKAVTDFVSSGVKLVEDIFGGMWDGIKAGIKMISDAWDGFWSGVQTAIHYLTTPSEWLKSLSTLGTFLYDTATAAFKKVWDWLVGLIPGGKAATQNKQEFVASRQQDGDSISHGAMGVASGALQLDGGKMWEGTKETASAIGGDIASGAKAVGHALNPFNWFADGTREIENTGLGVLHKGEAVIPSEDLKNLTAKGNGPFSAGPDIAPDVAPQISEAPSNSNILQKILDSVNSGFKRTVTTLSMGFSGRSGIVSAKNKELTAYSQKMTDADSTKSLSDAIKSNSDASNPPATNPKTSNIPGATPGTLTSTNPLMGPPAPGGNPIAVPDTAVPAAPVPDAPADIHRDILDRQNKKADYYRKLAVEGNNVNKSSLQSQLSPEFLQRQAMLAAQRPKTRTIDLQNPPAAQPQMAQPVPPPPQTGDALSEKFASARERNAKLFGKPGEPVPTPPAKGIENKLNAATTPAAVQTVQTLNNEAGAAAANLADTGSPQNMAIPSIRRGVPVQTAQADTNTVNAVSPMDIEQRVTQDRAGTSSKSNAPGTKDMAAVAESTSRSVDLLARMVELQQKTVDLLTPIGGGGSSGAGTPSTRTQRRTPYANSDYGLWQDGSTQKNASKQVTTNGFV